MFEPKVVAIGATIGFALSFLIGLFSGAAFLAVLLRAVIIAVFSGGFVFAVRYAITRYLPELTENPPQNPDDGAVTGSAVNITIDGNEPDHDIFSGQDAQNTGEMVPDFLAGESKVEAEEAREAGTDGFVPLYPVQGVRQPEAAPNPTQAGVVDAGSPRAAAAQASAKATVGGLDVLPDIQDFVPQTRDEDEEGAPAEGEMASNVDLSGFGSEERGSSRSSLSDAGGKLAGMESETMAKAIRTILTREG
jgi:hypothetical protein